jgi:hypothetical protein
MSESSFGKDWLLRWPESEKVRAGCLQSRAWSHGRFRAILQSFARNFLVNRYYS